MLLKLSHFVCWCWILCRIMLLYMWCTEIVYHWNSFLEQECCLYSFICILFLTHICNAEPNARNDWRLVCHMFSPGAITTPSQAQAPGVSPTWRQCTASYFWAISFLKDHYSTHRPNTILKTSITNQEPTYFQKATSHFKILGTMKVTRSTSHSEDP